jgi:hypothetical protein
MIEKLLSIFRKKKIKAKVFVYDDNELKQINVIPIQNHIEKPKIKRNRKTLTREEMWNIICNHYEIFNNFNLNPQAMSDSYIKRDTIWKFFVEVGLHKSPRLTPKQKEKIKLELVNRL